MTTEQKIFKNMGWPNKTINRSEENIMHEMISFKEARDKIDYKRKAALAKPEVRRRTRASWDKWFKHLEHETNRTQPKVYKILRQISKDIKETAKIHVYTEENIFLQYCEKLWNTTSINEPQFEWNLDNKIHILIISAALGKALKLAKNSKSLGK